MVKDNKNEFQVFTRINVHQLNQLEQLQTIKNYPNRSDVVRDAIEQYIQNEGNVIGSRRHFNRTMASLLNELKEIIIITFTWMLVLVAQGLTSILNALSKGKQEFNPMDLVIESSKVAMKQYPMIRTTIEEMREAKEEDKTGEA